MARLLTSLPRLARPQVRSFTTGEVKKADPKLVSDIQSKQKAYQMSDEEPVHIKSGKIHFYATTALGLCLGLGWIRALYNLIQ